MLINVAGVMLSISRSRYRFLVQFTFLAVNAVGVLLVTIYNASTPDLYPNNAHHKLGWVSTCVAGAQVFLGMLSAYAERKPQGKREEQASFIPISQEAMIEHQRMSNLRFQDAHQFSCDGGHGTEPNTESPRSQSMSSTESDQLTLCNMQDELLEEAHEGEEERFRSLSSSRLDRFLSTKTSRLFNSKLLRAFQLLYKSTDCCILFLAWVGFLTGWVTHGGFFVGRSTFSIS
jgi:hypothetical protein